MYYFIKSIKIINNFKYLQNRIFLEMKKYYMKALYPLYSILFVSGCGIKEEESKKKHASSQIAFNTSYGSSNACGNIEIDLDEILDSNALKDKKYQSFKEKLVKLYEHYDINEIFLGKYKTLVAEHSVDPIDEFIDSLEIVLSDNVNSIDPAIKNLKILKNSLDNVSNRLNKIKNFMAENGSKVSPQDDYYIQLEDIAFKSKIDTENFFNIVEKIKETNQIPEHFIPNIFHKKINVGNTIEFMNSESGDLRSFKINENQFKQFEISRSRLNDLLILEKDPDNHSEEGHSALNIAFAIQAIMELRNRNEGNSGESLSVYGKLIMAHAYVSKSQIALGIIDEAKYISEIVSTLKASNSLNVLSSEVGSLSKLSGKITGGLGAALQALSVGLDIAEVAYAKSYYEKSTAISNLTFDSVGLGLQAAGVLGSSTAGVLAVPLVGVGIGVTAIVGEIAKHSDGAIEIANTIQQYENSYKNYMLPNNYNEFLKSLYNKENPHINFAIINNNYNTDPIYEIDLSAYGNIKIKSKSHYISKTLDPAKNDKMQNGHPYPFVSRGVILNKHIPLDKSKFVSLKEAIFDRGDEEVNFSIISAPGLTSKSFPPIILPFYPETFYSYDYKVLSIRNDVYDLEPRSTFSSLLKLTRRDDFTYRYEADLDYRIMSELERRYSDSNITIKLAENSGQLITPDIPDEFKNIVHYNLEGSFGGHYNIQVKNGASYHVSGTGQETFLFDVSSVSTEPDQNTNISSGNNRQVININGVQISFNENQKPKRILFKHDNKQISEFDLEDLIYKVPNFKINGSINTDIKSSLETYRDILQEKKKYSNSKYIEINAIHSKSWFDIDSNEFIYPGNSIFRDNSNQAITDAVNFSSLNFLGKSNDRYFYYDMGTKNIYFNYSNGENLKKLLQINPFINNIKRPILMSNELVFESSYTNVSNLDYRNLFVFSTFDNKITNISLNYIKPDTRKMTNELLLRYKEKVADLKSANNIILSIINPTIGTINFSINKEKMNEIESEIKRINTIPDQYQLVNQIIQNNTDSYKYYFDDFVKILGINEKPRNHFEWIDIQNSKMVSYEGILENGETVNIIGMNKDKNNVVKYYFYNPNSKELLSMIKNTDHTDFSIISNKAIYPFMFENSLYALMEGGLTFDFTEKSPRLVKLSMEIIDKDQIERRLTDLKNEYPNLKISNLLYVNGKDRRAIYYSQSKDESIKLYYPDTYEFQE